MQLDNDRYVFRACVRIFNIDERGREIEIIIIISYKPYFYINSKFFFTIIEKNRSHHLIKSYGAEGRKYPEVPRVKYLLLPKCGTKYKNSGTKYWFNLIFIDQRPEKIQGNKYLKVSFGTLQSL